MKPILAATKPTSRKTFAGITFARDNILHGVEALLDPLVVVISLWIVAFVYENDLPPHYLIMSLILFSLMFPSTTKISQPISSVIQNTLLAWFVLAGLLMAFGYASEYIYIFPKASITLWLWLTPTLLIAATLGLRMAAPLLIKMQGPMRRAVIAGMNEQGLALAERLQRSHYHPTELQGFFEDRSVDRLNSELHYPILGRIDSMAEYVKEHHINTIYLSLPMASQPRIMKLLDDLKDTTASIYFVPDIFMTDLIQGRVDQVENIPVVSVCETPFTGFDGLLKRTADIAFSLLILILISPVLLVIAIGVKMSSPGPVIFKQRRYGLDGEEILVYKFRSMTVCEDGAKVTQATKNDQRTTKFGAFLRRNSLDELPQFINVLQGRMSVVGPRPHAVSHNEMYRKLIKGYMIRHKVKPGITGWAQVNGLRGETETLDKMKARIDYDIDYLRNWTPKLDMYIIYKTVSVVFTGEKNAY
ncbi:undecaprenyl-phosphate glucose phosphotransferase [Methylovorus glucosotrophus]|uniref:Undecaprenyl-phosphate glucose phosphotransferase n=1 Tax=Methylovorus glucosotrophus (strain SIP3-4) TaxID=582744 RepID=C6X6U1_METGS|nr:undecaprenyl-phosphate glucose phosphotransferase [Methylovorus glucosotrophus]ACT51084.1 Undecaprenyl-phosphate glucose phosphotransferase [Methylovorus glucosotrophus SIP3-4]